jgi:cyclophilin family peptidyl-prolyl cis-trans isomerase
MRSKRPRLDVWRSAVLFAGLFGLLPAAATQTLKLSDTPIADNEELVALVTVGLGKETLGTVTIRLHHKYAPEHVKNFVKLAESGFYDGIPFHRTEPESFVQGGDPLAKDANVDNDGTGGPGYDLTPEINDKPFVRGTLGAASMGKRDNGSQFFICLKDHPDWDHKYTAFGNVMNGLEVADKVAAGKRKGEHPVDNYVMTVKVEKRTKQMKLY